MSDTLLIHFPNLTLADVTRETARRAAQHRVAHNVRPADGLQAATALVHGATGFVTNDQRLAKVDQIQVLLLDDYLT